MLADVKWLSIIWDNTQAYNDLRMKWFFCTEIPFRSLGINNPLETHMHSRYLTNMTDVNTYVVEAADF